MSDSDLFSDNPKQRWLAARPLARKDTYRLVARVKNYPTDRLSDVKETDVDPLSALPESYQFQVADWGGKFSLYGSLNAWLVFIGPSPGGSPASGHIDNLLDSAFHHRNPVIGAPHPSLYYPDRRGFTGRIREWVIESFRLARVFHDEESALSNFLMLNLVKRPSGKAADVSPEVMKRRASAFWNAVEPIVRPGLIVALTRPVFDVLVRTRPSTTRIDGVHEVEIVAGNKRYRLPSANARAASGRTFMVTTVPQHPSAPYFPVAEMSKVHRHLADCMVKVYEPSLA